MWPVFVINMAENTRRMAKAAAELEREGIAFTRFEAVVGREVTRAELAKVYDAAANRRVFRHPLLAGEIGCYLSHIGVWRKLLDSDAKGAVVLEDDLSAGPHLKDVLETLSGDERPWDMVKLYARRPEARQIGAEALTQGTALVRPYQIPNTTLGYVIRRDAAERLLARSQPFARPIDEDHKRFWEHGLDIRLVVPPPLGLSEESETGDTIAASRKHVAASPRQAWRNLAYRLEYRLALLRARRGLR